VLGVTLSELLSGLEDGTALSRKSKHAPGSGSQRVSDTALLMAEIRQLVRRLALQHTAMDRTIVNFEELAVRTPQTRKGSQREEIDVGNGLKVPKPVSPAMRRPVCRAPSSIRNLDDG
jgi:hypothetical protein